MTGGLSYQNSLVLNLNPTGHNWSLHQLIHYRYRYTFTTETMIFKQYEFIHHGISSDNRLCGGSVNKQVYSVFSHWAVSGNQKLTCVLIMHYSRPVCQIQSVVPRCVTVHSHSGIWVTLKTLQDCDWWGFYNFWYNLWFLWSFLNSLHCRKMCMLDYVF